ncbi:MAG TPA: lactonase family protein, partial [Polyangiaceae bacterium]
MSAFLVRSGPFFLLACVGVGACAPTPSPAAPPAQSTGGSLVGYASGYGPDIDLLALDGATGAPTIKARVPSFGAAPSFLAVSHARTHLYALDEDAKGRVGAYAVDRATGALSFLNDVSSGGDGPAHVSLDATDRFVLVANYGDGTVAVLPVGADGRLSPPVQRLSVGAQAHMAIVDPSNHFVFVPCKGADYVAQFVFDASTGTLTPNAVPRVATAAGAGPRHLAFHPNGKFAYLINELDNTMTAYAFDASTGTLAAFETKSTLPAGFTGKDTAAEVWVHPSGRWLVGSNRGDDSLVVFALDPATGRMTLQGHTKSGGVAPRDFSFDPSGSFVYVANQKTNAVSSFRFDARDGSLTAVGAPLSVQGASFVGLVRLP